MSGSKFLNYGFDKVPGCAADGKAQTGAMVFGYPTFLLLALVGHLKFFFASHYNIFWRIEVKYSPSGLGAHFQRCLLGQPA